MSTSNTFGSSSTTISRTRRFLVAAPTDPSGQSGRPSSTAPKASPATARQAFQETLQSPAPEQRDYLYSIGPGVLHRRTAPPRPQAPSAPARATAGRRDRRTRAVHALLNRHEQATVGVAVDVGRDARYRTEVSLTRADGFDSLHAMTAGPRWNTSAAIVGLGITEMGK